jgi:peptidoglycan/LPS O-acetylase OafA/YrhL
VNPAAPPAKSERREEIQALRAIAVALVVVFHAWPRILPGGYTGVDVFFVISGFLITGQLTRELGRTGTISLAAFWARRARRLLPAAFTTLLICTAGTLLLVPRPFWEGFLREIAASAMYVENWALAADAVNYHAAGKLASPVKHFWSLSVEEQFYLCWPLLMLVPALAAGAVARARGHLVRRRAAIVTLALVTIASLAWAIASTKLDPTRSYYSTPARAWEFGVGGLLAMATAGRPGRRIAGAAGRTRSGLLALGSWLGLAAIVYGALTLGPGADVPGTDALLPVAGALLVIGCGMPAAGWSPARLLALRPVQFTGDVSYSAYLWHWPLLVALPFTVGSGTGAWRWVAVALTLPLAWCSKRFVEDPVRRARRPVLRAPRRTLALAAVSSVFVIGAPVGAMAYIRNQARDATSLAERIAADPPRCFGAAARDPKRPCANVALRDQAVPAPIAAEQLPNAPCERVRRARPLSVCEFGAPYARGTRAVALIGDSHAMHWRGAIQGVAAAEGWHGVSITRSGCGYSRALKRERRALSAGCRRWREAIPVWLARHPRIHTVFVSGITGGPVIAERGKSRLETEVSGFQQAWHELPQSVRRIVVLRDTPRMRTPTIACVQHALDRRAATAGACGVPRSQALQTDAAVLAARRIHSPRASIVDLSDVFCGQRDCYPVIGGALVYKDGHHLSSLFAQTLAPILRRSAARIVDASS